MSITVTGEFKTPYDARQAAEAAGAQFLFSHAAIALITDDSGRVTGVYAKDADGAIKRVNASQAVILASGGFAQFAAGCVIVAIPIVTLFMFLQKYYVEGVTAGAVKG